MLIGGFILLASAFLNLIITFMWANFLVIYSDANNLGLVYKSASMIYGSLSQIPFYYWLVISAQFFIAILFIVVGLKAKRYKK